MSPHPHLRGTRRELVLALPAVALAVIAATTPGDATVVRDVGLRGPENLVYDAAADVYLVSNVNGSPTARDDNGYISRVAPSGRVLDLEWIRGGRRGVTLDGPMGLAIRGDTLAVCDLAAVRFFDRRTGRPLGVVPTPGLRLNDLAYTDDGALWVTDTGPDRHTAGGVLQVDTTRDMDAVYRIVPGRPGGAVQTVARGLSLHRPDGISPDGSGRALVTTFGDSVLERVGAADSSVAIITKLPGGRVDGLRPAPGGGWFVSSWDAGTVWRFRPGEPLLPVLRGVTSPAGLAVDARGGQLAVTSMQDNALHLVPLAPPTRP